MHPKIMPSFWSDADFERFEAEQLVELRLVFLWAVTNPGTDMLGIFTPSQRRFAMDTGLDPKALARGWHALPKAFFVDPESGKVWLRNFIRYQFGVGDALARNKMSVVLRRAACMAPPRIRAEVYQLYPELIPMASPSHGDAIPSPDSAQPRESLSHPPAPSGQNSAKFASPCHGDAMGQRREEKEKEQHSTAQGGAGGGIDVTPPTVEQCIAAGAAVGLSAEECRAFHAHYEGLGWHYGTTPMRKPLSWLPKWRKIGQEKRHLARKTNGHPSRGPSRRSESEILDLRAELQVCTDPDRRAKLLAELAKAEAEA